MFLNGRAEEILASLREEMEQASDAWNFERAAEVRDRIAAIRSRIGTAKDRQPIHANADLLPCAKGEGGDAGVQVGFLRGGRLLGSEFFAMQARIEDHQAKFWLASSASSMPTRRWCR